MAKTKQAKINQSRAYDAALLCAHVYNDQDMVQALHKAYPNINELRSNDVNYGYETVLHLAVMRNYPLLVDLLLQAGADVEVRSMFKNTPLMYAAIEGYIELADKLLRAGAAMDAHNGYGLTALMQATEENHLDIVKLLVDRGANLDQTCDFGDTALMKAARLGYVETALYFIQKGAGLQFKNREDQTVVNIANEKSIEIFNFIYSWKMADQTPKEPESATPDGFGF